MCVLLYFVFLLITWIYKKIGILAYQPNTKQAKKPTFNQFLPVACPIAFKSFTSLVAIPHKADCQASQPTHVALIAP